MMDFITGYPLYVTAVLFIGFAIPVCIQDVKSLKINNFIMYMGIVCMLCYRFACTRDQLILYIFSAVASVLLFIFVRESTKKGLGWADVIFSALCGIYAGPVAVFAGYILAAAFAGIHVFVLKKKGVYHKGYKLPFTPYMALGTFITTLVPIVKGLCS